MVGRVVGLVVGRVVGLVVGLVVGGAGVPKENAKHSS